VEAYAARAFSPAFSQVPVAPLDSAYGYRYGEVRLDALPPTDPSFKFKEGAVSSMTSDVLGGAKRSIVASSLGCHLLGAALPHCDPDDPDTLHAGILKRFALDPPKARAGLLAGLKKFTLEFCQTHLTPLPANSDLSVEHWLETTNYPQWRKEQLQQKWNAIGGRLHNKKRWWICKSFMKDEPYVAYKHARAINSRSDEFKCAVGPTFKLI
jgi:hypothetical protein